MVAVNSNTKVKRRARVLHDVFVRYWRDAHDPLCAPLPDLGYWAPYHFDQAGTTQAYQSDAT